MIHQQHGQSNALDNLKTAEQKAGAIFHKALDAFIAKKAEDAVHFADPQTAFVQGTVAGRRRFDEWNDATRRRRAAEEFNEMITIGGVSWRMRELGQKARDAVYLAAAAHGFDLTAWPADVRDALIATLKANPRPPTYPEAAAERRKAFANVTTAVNATLAEHGLDPTKWPAEAVDLVARAELHAHAFDRLCARAQTLDSEWDRRSTTEGKE